MYSNLNYKGAAMNDKYNQSHNKDLTAHAAINNISKEDRQVNELIRVLKYIINSAGFEVIGRIQLRNIESRRKYL